MADDIEGLNPNLLQAFNSMRAAAAKDGITIGIGSGHRTVDEQIALRRAHCGSSSYDIWQKPANQCSPPTAIPGRSQHNHGLAIDFTGNDEADSWVARNASRFGLHLPVSGENWHLELIDSDKIAGAAGAAVGFGFANELTKANPEDELASRLHSILKVVGMGDMQIDEPTDLMGINAVPEDFEGGNLPGEETIGIPVSGGQNVTPGAGGPNPQSMGKFSGTVSGAYQNFAKKKMQEYGWSEQEMAALIPLWNKESNWNPNAQNPTSTAYGIAQFLNGTWAGTGFEKTSDPYTQIRAGLQYIKGRYGSPSNAWNFWQKNNWY